MAHLLLDSCKLGDFASKWSAIAGTVTFQSAVAGRWGTNGVVQIASSGGFVSSSFTAQNGAGIGAAVHQGGAAIAALSLFGDAGVTQHLTAHVNSDRSVSLRRGSATGTLILTSSAGVVPSLSDWCYLELICYTVHDTTGHALVRVNGATVIDYTGDTRNGGTLTTFDAARITTTAAGTLRFEDALLFDTTGGSPWNDFVGDVRIAVELPNGNGTFSQLLGSDADSVNDYLLVNSGSPQQVTYVGSGTPGQHDTYAMSDLPAGTVTAYSVQVLDYAWKNDAGLVNGKTMVRSGSTNATGVSTALGTSPTLLRTIHQVDPATAAAWLVAAVNALEVGFEVA